MYSIYIPTFRSTKDILQNATRFKNAMKTAGTIAPNIDMEAAVSLLDDNNAEFWKYQKEAFVLFISSENTRGYRLSMDTPQVVVAAVQSDWRRIGVPF